MAARVPVQALRLPRGEGSSVTITTFTGCDLGLLLVAMAQQVRRVYGASMSPDATAFAHIVDDGGYPRAVQRFLRGWRASSSRDVELPVEGPVTRVVHSADGHWLACEVAPDGGSRTQIWVVTTDPDDRAAHRIDTESGGANGAADADVEGIDGTAELIGWD